MLGFQVALAVKNLPAYTGEVRDEGSIHGLGKMPWSRKWQSTPALLPRKSNG